jgi:hypothetical protein
MLSTLFKRRRKKDTATQRQTGVSKKLTRHAFPWATQPTYATVSSYDAIPTLKADYQRYGIIKLKGLLNIDEAAQYLQWVQQITGLDDTSYARIINGDERPYVSPGTVTRHQQLWPLIAHHRLQASLASIIGSQPKHIGRDSVFVHNSSKGFHRDSDVYNAGFTWGLNNEYTVNDINDHTLCRVMFYFNSNGQPINRLGFVPFSHRHPQPLPEGWNDTVEALDDYPVWLPIEPGDVVVFDPRLRHSGEDLFGPKYSLVMTFGGDCPYNQYNAMESRASGDYLGYNDATPEFIEFLKANNLLLSGFDNDQLLAQYMERFNTERQAGKTRDLKRREKFRV